MSERISMAGDSNFPHRSLCRLLEDSGYRVAEFVECEEALEVLHRQKIEIVSGDPCTPPADGRLPTAAINVANPEVPVIVVYRSRTTGDAISAVNSGAWSHLVKPFTNDGELEISNSFLKWARQVDESISYHEHLEDKLLSQTRELRENERKFEALFEARTEGLLLIEVETCTIKLCNQAMASLLGLTKEETELICTGHVQPPDNLTNVLKQFERLSGGYSPSMRDIPVKRKNGTVFYADINTSRIEFDKVSYFFCSFHDVTDRKGTQEKLERQMENFRALRTIDIAIGGCLDLRVTFDVILSETLKQLHVDAACILLLNASSQMLEYAAGQGFASDRIRFASVRLGESYAGHVALARKNRIIADVASAKDQTGPRSLFSCEGFKAYVGVPLLAKGQVKGVLELFRQVPFHPDGNWMIFAEALAGQAAIAADNSELFEKLQSSHSELLMAYDTTIEGWSRALDYRDKETEGHSKRVTALTVRIARELGVNKESLVHIRRGALLHDIGKLGVPDSILLKPGKLTDKEFEIMKTHTEVAFNILYPIEFLRPALDIPYCHHENWNGGGYPRGLKGEDIPFAARIFAIVDVWDALLSDRPYRKAWPLKKIRDHISSLSGTHFDPSLIAKIQDIISTFANESRVCGVEPLAKKPHSYL